MSELAEREEAIVRDIRESHLLDSDVATRSKTVREAFTDLMIQNVRRWDVPVRHFPDVRDPEAREALMLFARWREAAGRGGVSDCQAWVAHLADDLSLEERRGARILPMALRLSGALGENENEEHFLRTQNERAIVPAIYRGVVRMREKEEKEEKVLEIERKPPVTSELATETKKMYNIVMPSSPEKPKKEGLEVAKQHLRTFQSVHGLNMWGSVMRNIIGKNVWDAVASGNDALVHSGTAPTAESSVAASGEEPQKVDGENQQKAGKKPEEKGKEEGKKLGEKSKGEKKDEEKDKDEAEKKKAA